MLLTHWRPQLPADRYDMIEEFNMDSKAECGQHT